MCPNLYLNSKSISKPLLKVLRNFSKCLKICPTVKKFVQVCGKIIFPHTWTIFFHTWTNFLTLGQISQHFQKGFSNRITVEKKIRTNILPMEKTRTIRKK